MELILKPEDLRLARNALLAASSNGVSVCAADAADARLNFMQFCQAATACPSGVAGHLSAAAFLRFRRSRAGAVSAAAVHAYLGRRAAMLQLWQHLAAFDGGGRGTLLTAELEHAIASLAKDLPGLSGVEQHLPLLMYAAAAARKLLFFHGCRGRVKIRDLVLSPVMAELLQLPPQTSPPQGGTGALKNTADGSPNFSSAAADAADTTATMPADTAEVATTALAAVAAPPADEDAIEDASWFAPATAARLVDMFCSLDADGQGLTPGDLIRFSGDNLTGFFVARVFEERAASSSSIDASSCTACTSMSSTAHSSAGIGSKQLQLACAPSQNPGPRLGLVDFLDFLLAWEHRGTPQGLRYFWPVLDLQRRGHLLRADVAAFFREVHALWLVRGQYSDLHIGDVVEEVFDLASPVNPQKITLKDLQRCGAGGDIVGILADVAAFWEHDSKEALLAAQAEAAHEDLLQLELPACSYC